MAPSIGRVGALAFLLGAGMMLGGACAVATADTDPSHHSAATARRSPAHAAKTAYATTTGSTVFAGRPRLAYNAAQNVQGGGGVITGALNPTQSDGYGLTTTVSTPPRNGSVTVNTGGTFSHAPNPATATVLENPGPPLPNSVLGTTDQLNAERLATDLARSPIVQIAKLVLKAGWLLAAHNNFASVGGPDATNMARLDQAITEYAIQAALEVQLLNSPDPKVIQQVAPPHNWYLQDFPGSRIWYDNPDTIYRFIGVNNASTYVITGRFDGSLPADTNFSVLTGLGGTTANNLNGRDLVLNPDGSFTITASAAPAAPGETNHLQLPAGTTLITTRNTLSDWNSQEPMSLEVLKVSGPPPSLFSQIGGFAFPGIGPLVTGSPLLTSLLSVIPPLPAPRLLQSIETAAIMLLLGISGENKYMGVATTDPKTGQLRAPNVLSTPDRNAEFLSTQLQSAGYFQLADNQALVLTINPGNARYVNVPVTDDWTITGNYWDQQTSLNLSQSVANPDGTYTFVIAKTDPGVANWISTGGLNQGTISIRFQDFDRSSPAAPTVHSQVVTLGDLPTALPATTVYVTAAQRAAQIAQRQLGYARRWWPYPQA